MSDVRMQGHNGDSFGSGRQESTRNRHVVLALCRMLAAWTYMCHIWLMPEHMDTKEATAGIDKEV